MKGRKFGLFGLLIVGLLWAWIFSRPIAHAEPLSSISGRVWHDLYHSDTHKVDGIQDPDEPGLANVVVELYDDADALVATTTTDSTGAYSFTGLTSGFYRVKIADSNFQAGGALDETDSAVDWHATLQDEGTDDTKDSDGDEYTYDTFVFLDIGEVKENVDFGFFRACVSLEKTGPEFMDPNGETITYHFRVENCGDVVLHGGVSVYDPLIEPSGDHQIWWSVVYPGEVYEFDRTYDASSSDCPLLVNMATAEGHPLHPRDGTGLPVVTDNDIWAVSCTQYDWGDAPASYGTTKADDGPRHAVNDSLVIGSLVDEDADGQPTTNADGDDTDGNDDEDGLTGCLSLVEGTQGLVAIPVHNSLGEDATLYGWVDFNKDGDFEDSGESTSVAVPQGTSGTVTLDFGTVPAGSAGNTFARLRLTTDSLCSGNDGTYRDEFSTAAYNNSDGTRDWSSTPWSELNDDGDPSNGSVHIADGKLQFVQLPANSGIQRSADLSDVSEAHLSFDWATESLEESISLYISADGTTFTRLLTFGSGNHTGQVDLDISPFMSANTTLRFVNDGGDWNNGDDVFWVDNFQIRFSTGCTGGPASDGEVEDHPVCIQAPRYSLGDYVWRDEDADGIQDPEESGINGVVVDLYLGSCDSLTEDSSPLQSTTTTTYNGVDGWYQFANLPAGNYCVVLSKDNYNPGGALVGLVASPAHASGDPATDSNASTNLRADVTLAGDDDTIDFGLHPVPPIESGVCYVVADNGDLLGLIDRTSGQVQVIGKVVPSDGENLAIRPEGFTIYNVAGEDSATPLITIDDQTAATTIINTDIGLQDVDALAFDPGTGILYAVAVNPNPGVLYMVDPNTGATTHVVDLQRPSPDPLASAYDPHIDGLAIDPETGIMYGAYSAWSTKSYLVTINPSTGEMTLVGGPPDDPGYMGVNDVEDISFHPSGTFYGVLGDQGAIGNDPDGSFEGLVIIDKNTAAATPVGPYGTPLQGLENWDVEAFACSVPATGSIGDFVWNDANGNGVQDEGSGFGIPNVTLRLYQDDGDNVFEPGTDDTLVDTQTTDSNGLYDFTHLPAGTYWVDVDESTLPSGYTLTTANEPHRVDLASGEDYNDADFGYVGRGDITGTVFYDWNENGTQDPGESGIGGVEVCLYKDDGDDTYDSGDTLEECVTTNSDGTYRFEDYYPGVYFVVETQPSGLESTTPNVRRVELVVAGASGLASGNDFGEVVKGRIGDRTWIDSDGDGVQDPGETSGLPNVPLHITGVDVTNAHIDITVTTSITGYYLVEDLLPGTYTVTAPSNAQGFVRTSTSPLTTTLSEGHMEDLTLDFGYIAPTGVQLIDFQVEKGDRQVELTWTVNVNHSAVPRFRVWRSTDQGKWKLLTGAWLEAREVSGSRAFYSYTDMTVQPGHVYEYRLESEDGTFLGPWRVSLRAQRLFVPVVWGR